MCLQRNRCRRCPGLTGWAGIIIPSPIYVRVGRYHDASTVNERATGVDEGYMKKANPTGTYPGGYYPHNIHFLWFATDLEGRSRDSIAAAKKVSHYTLDLRCGAIEGPRQRYLPLLAYARFGRWKEILNEKLPGEEYPFDRAMAHYARGLAFAAGAQVNEAQHELDAFRKLQTNSAVVAMDNPYFPGTKILAVGAHVLAGKVAGAANRPGEMVTELRAAVKTEHELSYMEPPYWYYPARPSPDLRPSLPAPILQHCDPGEFDRGTHRGLDWKGELVRRQAR